MMKRYLLTISAFLLLASIMTAQKVIDGNVVYGNEWIDFDKSYLKIRVAKDGMYKISKAELAEAGFEVNATEMSNYKLMHIGKEVPIKTSTDGIPSDEDYFFFYGEKNRAEVDRFGYEDDSFILNPEYSLVSDTSAYFLTVDTGQNKRYEEVYTTSEDLSTPVSPYFLFEEKAVYTQRLYDPTLNEENVSYSHLVEAEGYGLIQKNKLNKKLTLENSYKNGPQAIITVRGATNRNNPHYVDVALEGETVFYDTINRNSIFDISHNIDVSDISGDLNIDVVGKANSADLNTLSIISALYPRESSDISDVTSFTINEKAHFVTEESSDEVSYLNIKDGKIVYGLNSGGENHIVIPGSDYSNYHKITDVFEKAILSTGLRKYSKLNTDDFDFLIITNKNLIGESTIVDEYSNFRSSAQGGNYSVRVVDVNELYDQYAYGVDRHFVSVRNYAFDLHEKNTNLKSVLILGKAVQYSNNRNPKPEGIQNYVPTFGSPGSDNLLFTMFGEWVSYIPVGRIAASNVDHIRNYLNKAKDYLDAYNLPQTIEDKYWMKNLMHLSGGGSSDFKTMRDNLNAMRDTITKEDNMVGAEVISFYKYNEEGVNESFLDKTLELINNGLAIISQFGHGAVNAVDFSIANPDKFDNHKKYHLLMSYGCLTGNCHTNGTGLSEDYVLNNGKGAIGFVATSGYAYPGNLGRFGRHFYDLYGTSHYSKSLGETMNKSFDLMKSSNPSYSLGTFLEQWTLHGDPAVELYHFYGADYTFDYSSVSTSPEQINAFEKDMKLCVDIYNLGKAITDSLDVKLIHFLEDNSVVLDTTLTIASPSGKDNVCFTLPLNSEKFIGKNRIELEINPDRTLEESPLPAAYNNNNLSSETGTKGFEFLIISDNAIATSPYKYGIVNDTKVNLIATTYNAFADSASYIMELDTTPYFNSGYKKSHRTTSRSPITWQVNVMDREDQVYFWRISPDTLSSNGAIKPNWDESSFTYIPGDVQGWNQGHWGQFDDNEFDMMSYDDNNNLVFSPWNRTFTIECFSGRALLNRDGIRIDEWKRIVPAGMTIVIVDKPTSRLTLNDKQGGFNSVPTNQRTFFHEYNMDTPEDRVKFYDIVRSDAFAGKYIIVSLFQSNNSQVNPTEWLADTNLLGYGFFDMLEEIGSSFTEDFKESQSPPLYSFTLDGDSKNLLDEGFSSSEGTLNFSSQLEVLHRSGLLKTTTIGPGISYNDVEFDFNMLTNYKDGNDTLKMAVYGITQDGTSRLIKELDTIYSHLLEDIDANIYPEIYIEIEAFDGRVRSIPPLEKILVKYQPVSDIIIDPIYTTIKEEYQVNQDLTIPIAIKNIGQSDAKSLFDLKISSRDSEAKSYYFERLKKDSIVKVDIPFNINESGQYSYNVEINTTKNLREEEYRNNTGIINLNVIGDNINNTQLVTFDGTQIMNNDIVSPTPLINIQLKDENQVLNLEDNIDFEILLTDEEGNTSNYTIEDPLVELISPESNEVNINFRPVFTESGTYKLKVRSKNKSNSKYVEYEVTFRVILEQKISNVYNYPNPFSTSTQFIFTLTGNELPSGMVLRIYTLSGKVVREITSEELGNIKIGLNKTDFRWDGTDEYGNKLANGVYMYKVITKDNAGKDYESFMDNDIKSAADYFNNGFGKMTIIR